MGYIVYILKSLSFPGKSYVGSTNDPGRRLRQHNGELAGGAKRTRYNGPWAFCCHVTGFKSRTEALQFEWALQHPSRSVRYRQLLACASKGPRYSPRRKVQEALIMCRLNSHLRVKC